MASHLPPPSPLRVFSVIIKSMKGYDKMARTLQYGSAFLLVTYFKKAGKIASILSKVKSTTGSCRRILRWGQWVSVLLNMNHKINHWHHACQWVSDVSVTMFYIVENLLYLSDVGILSLDKEQKSRLAWLSDFFWLFEVLPLVPMYYNKIKTAASEKSGRGTSESLLRGFSINFLDTFVAAHDLGFKHGVSTPNRHLFGTITSLIGLRSVQRAAYQVAAEQEMEILEKKHN
ncbi:hypothetical protein AAMO2058_001206600 [Amorphochlora amoebiformis]